MKPVSEVTAMVIDTGCFMSYAQALGKHFKKVYYCNPSWVTSYSTMNMAFIGYGYPEMEMVLSPFDHFEDVDLFCFLDAGWGPMQAYLESAGKAVWGARNGEELELCREDCKKIMAEVGLPVNKYVAITGLEKLNEHLKKNNNQWVKIDRFRGHGESFFAKNYKQIKSKLQELAWQLGPMGKIVEFIVEDDLPAKDYFDGGVDCYCIDGKFPENIFCGIEVKDKADVGKMVKYSNMPESITGFDKKMAPVMKGYGYRGPYSTEIRVNRQGVGYMIDFCSRCGSPPSEIYSTLFTNLGEIAWKGANGILVEPIPLAKWGAQVMLESTWALKNWQNVEIPKSMAPFLKLQNGITIDGELYMIPQPSVQKVCLGAVIGYGSSIEAAVKMVREVAEAVEGYYLSCPTEALDEAEEEINKAREFGAWPKGE